MKYDSPPSGTPFSTTAGLDRSRPRRDGTKYEATRGPAVSERRLIDLAAASGSSKQRPVSGTVFNLRRGAIGLSAEQLTR
jgi:hypothetical protein